MGAMNGTQGNVTFPSGYTTEAGAAHMSVVLTIQFQSTILVDQQLLLLSKRSQAYYM